MRSEVVLPQPLGPTRTMVLPAGTSRSSPSTATVPSGYRFVTASNVIKPPARPFIIKSLFSDRINLEYSSATILPATSPGIPGPGRIHPPTGSPSGR